MAAFQILVVGVGIDAGIHNLDIVHNSQYTLINTALLHVHENYALQHIETSLYLMHYAFLLEASVQVLIVLGPVEKVPDVGLLPGGVGFAACLRSHLVGVVTVAGVQVLVALAAERSSHFEAGSYVKALDVKSHYSLYDRNTNKS